MKKNIIIILFVLVSALGLAGCQNNTEKSADNQTIPASTNDKTNTTEKTTPNNQEKSNTDNQPSSNTQSNNTNQESKKQEYKAKLDKIELGFKGFDDDVTTNDMYQHACKEHKQWDDVLNEIYGVLRVQLSPSEMKKLQSEEIQWIKDRDAKAKKDAAEMAGGTMEKVLFAGSLAKSTKERCYVLVDKYMK